MYPVVTALFLILVLGLAIHSVFWLSERLRAKVRKPVPSLHVWTYLRRFAFLVKIPGLKSSHFTQCSELAKSDGCSVLTLTRGARAEDRDLEEWAKSGDTRSVSVLALDRDGEEVRRFEFGPARPMYYTVGPFDNSADEYLTESITLMNDPEAK